jgi:hypothetical protein
MNYDALRAAAADAAYPDRRYDRDIARAHRKRYYAEITACPTPPAVFSLDVTALRQLVSLLRNEIAPLMVRA